jgi:hypothetical protein
MSHSCFASWTAKVDDVAFEPILSTRRPTQYPNAPSQLLIPTAQICLVKFAGKYIPSKPIVPQWKYFVPTILSDLILSVTVVGYWFFRVPTQTPNNYWDRSSVAGGGSHLWIIEDVFLAVVWQREIFAFKPAITECMYKQTRETSGQSRLFLLSIDHANKQYHQRSRCSAHPSNSAKIRPNSVLYGN